MVWQTTRTVLSPASLFELRRALLRPGCVFGWLATRSPPNGPGGEGWCPVRDSNPQPPDYKSGALPIEPTGRPCRATAKALSEKTGPGHRFDPGIDGGFDRGSDGDFDRRLERAKGAAGGRGCAEIDRTKTNYSGLDRSILGSRRLHVSASVHQLNTLVDFLGYLVETDFRKGGRFSTLSLLRLMKSRLNLTESCFKVSFVKGDGHAGRWPVGPWRRFLLGYETVGGRCLWQAVPTRHGERKRSCAAANR